LCFSVVCLESVVVGRCEIVKGMEGVLGGR
jgi:hypothetical protein